MSAAGTDWKEYLDVIDEDDKNSRIKKAANTTNTIYIGIVGSRKRDSLVDQLKVNTAFNNLKIQLTNNYHSTRDNNLHIVSGGATTGADRFAELIAKSEQLPITIYYPKWRQHGNSGAAMIRNKIIADQSDYLIACRAAAGSPGTDYTISQFKKKFDNDDNILKSRLIVI